MCSGALVKDAGLHVVLLNWNHGRQTLDCLSRIREWAPLRSIVHVVDNGSTDDSVPLLESAGEGIVLHRSPSNRGYGGGNNVALRLLLDETATNQPKEMAAEYILLLNTDAHIDGPDLGKLLDQLERDSGIGVIGPVLYSRKEPSRLISAGGRDPLQYTRTYADVLPSRQLTRAQQPCEVDYVPGTVALLRRTALVRAGLFDEAYFFSCEMTDLCWRIKQQGYRCMVDPCSRAWHDMDHAGSLRQTLYLYYSLRNRFLLMERFASRPWPLRRKWLVVGLKGMAASLLRGQLAGARAHGLALYHGLLRRFGDQNHFFLQDSDHDIR